MGPKIQFLTLYKCFVINSEFRLQSSNNKQLLVANQSCLRFLSLLNGGGGGGGGGGKPQNKPSGEF